VNRIEIRRHEVARRRRQLILLFALAILAALVWLFFDLIEAWV
jgi:hypothetical protein